MFVQKSNFFQMQKNKKRKKKRRGEDLKNTLTRNSNNMKQTNLEGELSNCTTLNICEKLVNFYHLRCELFFASEIVENMFF
jgi:hypothetical protein